MKICVDMGHTPTSPGASKYLDELTEDRKVGKALIAELKKRGHTVVNTTPADSVGYPNEINKRVATANASGASLFCSVHFNAGGGTGTECLYYSGDSRGKSIADKISANVSKVLGLTDRGPKARTNEVGVIRDTNMTAVLVEICFVDTKKDETAYRKSTASEIASAIADGLVGKRKKKILQCSENGYWGTATTRVWQAINGIEESGKVLRQLPGSKAHLKACTSSKFSNHSFSFARSDKAAKGGSLAIKRLQNRKLGIPWKDCNGWMDAKTRRLFVAKYYGKGYTTTDLLAPSKAVKAFQKEINAEARKLGIKR